VAVGGGSDSDDLDLVGGAVKGRYQEIRRLVRKCMTIKSS
jgi:hypothetical protein